MQIVSAPGLGICQSRGSAQRAAAAGWHLTGDSMESHGGYEQKMVISYWISWEIKNLNGGFFVVV